MAGMFHTRRGYLLNEHNPLISIDYSTKEISRITPFTQVRFAATYTHAESVEGHPQVIYHSSIHISHVVVVHWLDLATLLGVAFQFVVPPSVIKPG